MLCSSAGGDCRERSASPGLVWDMLQGCAPSVPADEVRS